MNLKIIPKEQQLRVKEEYKLVREKFIAEFGGLCWHCGSAKALSLHHILPVKYGGLNLKINFMLLCLDKSSPLHGCHWRWNGLSYQWLKNHKDFVLSHSKRQIIRQMRKSLIDGNLPYKPQFI